MGSTGTIMWLLLPHPPTSPPSVGQCLSASCNPFCHLVYLGLCPFLPLKSGTCLLPESIHPPTQYSVCPGDPHLSGLFISSIGLYTPATHQGFLRDTVSSLTSLSSSAPGLTSAAALPRSSFISLNPSPCPQSLGDAEGHPPGNCGQTS